MVTTLSLDPRDPAEPLNLQNRRTHATGSDTGRAKGKRTLSHTRASERRAISFAIGFASEEKEKKGRKKRREERERGRKKKRERESVNSEKSRETCEADALSSRGSRGTILTSRLWGARISCRQDHHPHRCRAEREALARHSGPVDQRRRDRRRHDPQTTDAHVSGLIINQSTTPICI